MIRTLLGLLVFAGLAFGQDGNPKVPPPVGGESPEVQRNLTDGLIHRLKNEFESLGRAKTQKQAPVTTDSCSAAEALTRASAWVGQKSSAGALDRLRADPAAKSVQGLVGLAGGAAVKGNLTAAIAALLEANRREPENGPVLADLASALASVGLCSEAVALGLLAEGKAGDAVGPMGLPWRLVALNARGFALLRQGKAAEAVAPLRTAAALGGPLASEVERNLALALKEIGETEEAKKVFLMACWRRKVDRPVCYGGKPGMDGDPFDPSRATRAPAALVYDLSAGVDGTLPVFKHPTQTAQFKAFIKFSQREAKASQEFLQKEAAWAATFNKKGLGSRTKTPADRRAMDIEHTLETIHLDPDVAPLYKAMKDGEADAKRLLDAHYTAGMKKMREILTSGTKDAQEQLRALNEESVAHAVASAQAFDTQLRAYWKVAGRYITGLAANVKDPDWHEKFVHDVAAAKWAIWGQLVVKVYGFYHQANGVGLPNPAEAEVEVPEMPGVEEDEVKSCSQGLKGKMVEFASGPLSITLDCESVGIEFSPEGVLSGFVSVEANVEGKVTVFAGPKLDVTVPGVLHGFTVRDGVYIVGDAKGIEDAGFRVHMETFEKHGEVRFKANFDQMDFSLMPSIH